MSVPDLIYGSLRALSIYEFYESLLTIYEVNMTVELYLKSIPFSCENSISSGQFIILQS
jgi:hypothetical protein